MRLPRLKQDTETLYRAWYMHQVLGSRDLVSVFGISRRTACKIIRAGKRKPEDRYISVDRLFAMYGWDANEVTEKYRQMKGGEADAGV